MDVACPTLLTIDEKVRHIYLNQLRPYVYFICRDAFLGVLYTLKSEHNFACRIGFCFLLQVRISKDNGFKSICVNSICYLYCLTHLMNPVFGLLAKGVYTHVVGLNRRIAG